MSIPSTFRPPRIVGPVLVMILAWSFGACEAPLDPEAITENGLTVRAERYLLDALGIVERHWIFRDGLDHDSVRADALRLAEGAEVPADTWDAIRAVLRGLDDGHSRLRAPSSFGAIGSSVSAVGSQGLHTGPRIVADRLAFYPVAPTDLTGALGDRWAEIIAVQIADLATHAPCGWIVDLRTNTGGNMWPMLAGLGGLIGEGRLGGFVDPADGSEAVDWFYHSGASWHGGQRVAVAGEAVSFDDPPPVAVLVGGRTASAGEAVVVSFIGRPGTRSFGETTAGASNAPRSHLLSDGAVLILAELVFVDRTGREYGRALAPDESVAGEVTGDLATDAVLARAAEWLLGLPECGAGS